MTPIAEFIMGIVGRILSSLFSTYLVRLLDKFTHKKDRQENNWQSLLC